MKLFDRLGKLRDRRRPYCTMIVPAAGESRRMGGGNKLLLPLECTLHKLQWQTQFHYLKEVQYDFLFPPSVYVSYKLPVG